MKEIAGLSKVNTPWLLAVLFLLSATSWLIVIELTKRGIKYL